jgi:hypothetical protein
MKALLAALTVILLIVSNGFAQSDVIIKKRAKELNNQNNVRQGVAPPSQPQPARPPATAPAPQQSSALSKLQASLAGITPGSTATAEQKQKLANDISAVAQTAKPSQAAATKLAEELWGGIAVKALSPASRSRLVQELDAVLNPAKYPQVKLPAVYDDIQAIFQENGLDRKRAVAISDAVKAVQSR